MKRLYILLFLIYSNISAQDYNGSFENISTVSGLSESLAKCIFQDSEGYLWVGTMGGGLNLYDGYSFKVFTNKERDSSSLSHNNVYNIAEDHDGFIWVANNVGVSKYIKNENRFINYNFRSLLSLPADMDFYSAYETFVDSKGRLWVGDAYNGALLYNRDKDKFVPIPQQSKDSIDALPQVYGDFTEDNNGVIWASAGTNGLMWYDDKSNLFRPAEMKNSDMSLLKSKEVFRTLADSENNIWILTRTDLYKYFPVTKNLIHLKNYSVQSPINEGYEGELFEDSNGDMLMVHINLTNPLKFVGLSNVYETIESEDMDATDIFEDSFGNIWVADWTYGIFKQVPSKQVFHNLVSDGQELWVRNRIDAVYYSGLDKDLLFVSSTMKGKINFSSYNLKTTEVESYNVSNSHVSAIFSNERGIYWLGTWGLGLLKWNRFTGEQLNYHDDDSIIPNMSNARVTNITQDNYGKIWIGTVNGLYRMNNDGSDLELVIPELGIASTYIDDNILWIGAYGEGLIKYDLKSGKSEEFVPNNSSNSLSSSIIWDIYRDRDGFLWLATENGLNRMDLRSNTFKVFDISDGLESNMIAAILPDGFGNLWFSSSAGISRITKKSSEQLNISNYNAKDGLNNPYFSRAFKTIDNNDRLYFGGNRGLYYFKSKIENSNPPITYISNLMINGQSISVPDNYNEIKYGNIKLDLNHTENTVFFEFLGIHFSQPSQNQYSYYLEGFESEWKQGNHRNVQYVNLDPGNYKFHLKSANRDGIWSPKEIIIPIYIREPWWNTWFAYTGYLIFLLGFLFTVRKVEIKRRNELESKRLLELENKRKSKELEEARKLQLSMLPRNIPQIPNLDIAVYMKTATEVGGDYYDFHVGIDGTFTAVIGDATGHGMKAGTMVTSAKSLFSSYAENDDIVGTFKEMTRCIKTMHLENLSMCMTMIKIQNNKLIMSSAGTPPIYLYRKNTTAVEEYLLEGMPLGTMKDFPYKTREVTLQSGDTILLMTDGFPELTNTEKEIFGYKQVRRVFEEVAENSPEDIIAALNNAGSDWAKGQDQEDDVTFVVIKLK